MILTYRWKSYRFILTFALFFFLRNVLIQENFLLSRPVGFLYFDPGWPCFTVPYDNILDFFYSGHVGTCFIYPWESYRNGHKILPVIGAIFWLSMWPFLIIVRTHYWIDLVTGSICVHWATI